MAISFINVATNQNLTASTSFTFTKPTNATTGDLLIGVVANGRATATDSSYACTGWTPLEDVYYDGAGDDVQMGVFSRVVQAGDPASWTGSSSVSLEYQSIVWCLRGADSTLLASETIETSGTSNSSYTSVTVNNTDSGAWRLGAVVWTDATGGASTGVSGNTFRVNDGALNVTGTDEMMFAACDSNGAIATGNTSITWTVPSGQDEGMTWIGLVAPSAGSATNAPSGAGAATATSNAPKAGVGAKAQVIG